ncbi:MAG TPA: hypothetical protein VGB63_02905 [Pedobacter sp.]|jgi:hypothetical protein
MEAQFTISSIVFVVWLIVPGVFFKRFYFQGEFTKQFGAGLFADRLITSIFWGTFVQIITFLIYSRAFGFTFTSIKGSVNRIYGEISHNVFPNITYTHLTYILGYLLASIFMAIVLGTFCHKVIRTFKLDVRFETLRFSNQWNYYFRGEILSSKDFKPFRKGKWLSTHVDVKLDVGGEKTKLFQGFLTQYSISSKTGELETLYLTNAKRYSETDNKFKEVPGDVFIIGYSRVVDLNIRYNIQFIDVNKRITLINNIIFIIGFAGLLAILILPWFLDFSFLRTLIGIIFATASWLMLIILCMNPFQLNKKLRLDKNALWTAFGMMICFGLIACQAFELFYRVW